jgi:hypothetical protein
MNVTVARNVAGGRGGGFIGNASGQINGTYSIQGSVIAGNTQPGPTGALVANNCNGITPTDLGGNLESGTDCGFRRSDDLQNANPLLGTLINLGGDTDVLALGTGSPALDFTTRPCLRVRESSNTGTSASCHHACQFPSSAAVALPIAHLTRTLAETRVERGWTLTGQERPRPTRWGLVRHCAATEQ